MSHKLSVRENCTSVYTYSSDNRRTKYSLAIEKILATCENCIVTFTVFKCVFEIFFTEKCLDLFREGHLFVVTILVLRLSF